MATWVECKAYTEDRHTLWVNLDQVITIWEHQNGSVLRLAISDEHGPIEISVWDRPQQILARKAK